MKKNKVRIIGGTLKRRWIEFPRIEGLRPSLDRVRETLFNWLIPYIEGANCLDCFSGSGVLGFEAISRGCAHATLIDTHYGCINALKENVNLLKINNVDIIQGTQPTALHQLHTPFDVVFLDPPFNSGLIEPCLEKLVANQLLSAKAVVYIEQPLKKDIIISQGFEILKESKTKNIRFNLIKLI